MFCTINDGVHKCDIYGRDRVYRIRVHVGQDIPTRQAGGKSFHCRLSNINMEESDMMLKEGKTGDLLLNLNSSEPRIRNHFLSLG